MADKLLPTLSDSCVTVVGYVSITYSQHKMHFCSVEYRLYPLCLAKSDYLFDLVEKIA